MKHRFMQFFILLLPTLLLFFSPLIAAQEGSEARTLSFAQMGNPQGIQLSGIHTTTTLNAGVRLDELIKQARMNLKLIYPPGMKHEQSFLNVRVNGQTAGVVQLSQAQAGIYHNVELEL
ncbi:MAG: hypothetical protein HC848_08515, partial [Limnobacter sp.]|nr:hypothetical protein [Limnobacter sp.]